MLAITSAIAALRASQSPQNQSVLALESTGRYHAQLALAAHAAGLRVYVLNPLDARRYAQCFGQRGKTDRMDALMLARYICHEHAHLRQWQPPTACQAALRELLAHRATLVRQRSALARAGNHRKELARLDEPALTALQQAIEWKGGPTLDPQLVSFASAPTMWACGKRWMNRSHRAATCTLSC